MAYRLHIRILSALVASVVGFGTVSLTQEASKTASPPEALGAVAARREPSRPLPETAEVVFLETRTSDADSSDCAPEQQALLEYGVRAARAEILTRYGRPPASLPLPTQAQIDDAFPEAVASFATCTPLPCRLMVATRTKTPDFKSLPEEWGYPNGVVTGGTYGGVYVLDFAFVSDELSPLEWKFVRNAWSVDREYIKEDLQTIFEDGDDE